MADIDCGANWDDMLKILSGIPKPRKETILMSEKDWAGAREIFGDNEDTSPFHVSSIPVNIADWATEIYLVPDDVLVRVLDFAKKFGGPAADRLLQHLAELAKRHGKEED